MMSYFVPYDMRKISFESVVSTLSDNDGYMEILFPMAAGGSVNCINVTGIMQFSEYPRKLKSGTWSTDAGETSDALVWVGESWEPYVLSEAGSKYLYIESVKCKVQGILDNTMTGSIDETIIVLLPSCSKSALSSFGARFNESAQNIGDIELTFFYHKDDDAPTEEWIKSSLDMNGLSTRKSYVVHHSEEDDAAEINRPLLIITAVILVFAIVNLSVVSSFYFAARQQELCVRKVFGVRGRVLLMMLIKDICRLFILALLAFVPIELVLKLSNSSFAVGITDGLVFILIGLISFLFLLLYLTVRFVLLFRKIRPENLLAR